MVINACFLKPMDKTLLIELTNLNIPIYVYETDLKECGLAKDMIYFYQQHHIQVNLKNYGLPEKFIQQGTVDQLLEELELSVKQILKEIERELNEKRKN